MATTNGVVDKVKQEQRELAHQTTHNPWIERLMRVGFAVRGILYATIGVLAVQVASGARGAPPDQQGAIAELGKQPFGYWLLILMAVGLIGYSLWGFVRAIFDPLKRGHDAKGLLERAGFLFSGVSYALLLLPTVQFLRGSQGGNGNSTQNASAQLLNTPAGPWLLGIIGLVAIGGGLWQAYYGWKTDFTKDLKSYDLTKDQRKWAVRLGRFGYIARGVVFALIGLFLVRAAITLNPNEARGLDGALLAVAQQPYGPFLLGVVALGLIAFGAYSILGAWWFRTKRGT